MVIDLRVEIALHDILLVVPIVCACPTAWGIGDLHQTAAVEVEPCPSAVGSMSPGVVELVEEEAFDRFYIFLVPVLLSVMTGLYLGPWANVVIDPRVKVALHDILLVVPIVCASPTAWGIGNLHQAAAVEEEPCLSVVGSMSPGAVDLVEDEAFDRFRRLISV